MPNKPKRFQPPGHKHRREYRKEYEAQRRATTDTRMYRIKWWEETRKRIANRDLWTCMVCGKDVGQAKGDYHCDHVEERPQGAAIDIETWDRDENLQTLCVSCHNAKTGRRHGWGTPPPP